MIRARMVAAVCALLASPAMSQVSMFPFAERFDSSAVLPAGWQSTGFSLSSSTSRSAPNCVSVTGNLTTKSLLSPVFDFERHVPLVMTFWERRSTTAASFRLEVIAEWDTIALTLAAFNSTSTTSSYVQRSVSLEGNGFDAASSVRFRWRLRGDSTSGAGVLRIDDITVAASASTDLSVGALRCTPALPRRSETVQAEITVHNRGRTPVTSFSVNVYAGESSLRLFDSGPVRSQSGGIIAQGDSILRIITLPGFVPGTHWIGARVVCPDDEAPGNDTLSVPLHVGASQNDLVINEVMYAPSGVEPEWVELFAPGTDTIDIGGWTISDNGLTVRARIADQALRVPPASYLIVAADTSFVNVYPAVDCSFHVAKFPALNNTTPDAVVIRDATGQTVDSVAYDPSLYPSDGRSLERIDHLGTANRPDNWHIADSSARSTPGKRNSVARLDHDLELSGVHLENGLSPTRPTVVCHIRNVGRVVVNGFRVTLRASERLGADTSSRTVGALDLSQPLLPHDSVLCSFIPDSLMPGRTTLSAMVVYADDERLANNTREIFVDRGYASGRLVINEIMYDPLSGSCEWVELHNPERIPVRLEGWTLSDLPSPSGSVNTILLSGFVPPEGFTIAAADSGIFHTYSDVSALAPGLVIVLNRSDGLGLNNDGDAVILRDLTGATIDSVRYDPNWHHPDVVETKGRSLERINPRFAPNDARNWSTCADPSGGTPGKRNSVFHPSLRSGATLSIAPNPFSPDGDGFEDFTVIRYSLPFPTAIINIKIFDIRGRMVRWLSNRELAGRDGTVVWDGMDDRRERVHIGPYVLLMQASADANAEPLAQKALVVVAKRF